MTITLAHYLVLGAILFIYSQVVIRREVITPGPVTLPEGEVL